MIPNRRESAMTTFFRKPDRRQRFLLAVDMQDWEGVTAHHQRLQPDRHPIPMAQGQGPTQGPCFTDR
jgi:hypothetical protein